MAPILQKCPVVWMKRRPWRWHDGKLLASYAPGQPHGFVKPQVKLLNAAESAALFSAVVCGISSADSIKLRSSSPFIRMLPALHPVVLFFTKP